MANAKKKNTQVYSSTRIMFLVAGLLLLVKYLLEGGLPSAGGDLGSIITFVVKLFVLIIVIGFYCYFAFGVEGYSGSFKALAPVVLLLMMFGSYSLDYGDANINAILTSVATLIWTLLTVTGFIFLFVRKKVLGLAFGWSCLIYSGFVIVSYIVMTIIGAVDNKAFNWTNLVTTLLLCASFALVFCGTYIGLRRREWTA